MRGLLLICLMALPAWANDTPEQVMNTLLSALKNNTADNAGIAQVFELAAPANKAMTGPLPRFINMVPRHPYGELVNHQSAVLGPPKTDAGAITYPIRLISKQGWAMGYVWTLEQQPDDSWMTSAVYPVAVSGQGL